jgi:hypothetical protein
VRAAVLGRGPSPGDEPDAPWALARAETLAQACALDGGKAVELIAAVQECLEHAAGEATHAAGLRAVAALCESDCLDFYAAWRVVRARFPTLPAAPAAAAAWVRLLASAFLDADVYPEIARGVVDALWAATAHPAAQVRRQAYASLAAFSFDTLEEIGALRALRRHARLLLAEAGAGDGAGAALEECEALVRLALAHEHATRRRPRLAPAASEAVSTSAARPAAGRAAAAAAADGGGALRHRLAATLPRAMLGGGGGVVELLKRLPEVPAPAVLHFWAPPPPDSKAAPGAAARQAAADYAAVFAEVCAQPMGGLHSAFGAAPCAARLAAWTPFLRRWAAACREAAGAQQADRGAAGWLAVWAEVRRVLQSAGGGSTTAAENAAWAAAALCAAPPQPLRSLAAEAHAALEALAEHEQQQQPVAVQRAALAGLGAIAAPLRPTVGFEAVEAAAVLLRSRLGEAGAPVPVRAGAAEGLGLACWQLAASAAAPGVQPLLERILQALLIAAEGAASAIDAELQQAALAALADALPAVAVVAGSAGLQARVHGLSAAACQQAGASAAAYNLLQAVALAAFVRNDAGAAAELSALLVRLEGIAGGRDAARSDGKARGAAAAALGSLVQGAQRAGFAFDGGSPGPTACLETLLALGAAAGTLPHAAAAKHGAAAGAAQLLHNAGVDPSGPLYKRAGARGRVSRRTSHLVLFNDAAAHRTAARSLCCSGRSGGAGAARRRSPQPKRLRLGPV